MRNNGGIDQTWKNENEALYDLCDLCDLCRAMLGYCDMQKCCTIGVFS
jgi:hypothetical protein